MKSLLTLVIITAVTLTAQEPRKPRAAYKLELKIRDSDDQRPGASRNYSFVLGEGMKGLLRAGKKVSLADKGYIDVGMNIDARVQQENPDDPALLADLELDISSLEGSSIHQMKWKGTSRVAPGKPTVIASLQDAILQKRLDLEITVTRLP